VAINTSVLKSTQESIYQKFLEGFTPFSSKLLSQKKKVIDLETVVHRRLPSPPIPKNHIKIIYQAGSSEAASTNELPPPNDLRRISLWCTSSCPTLNDQERG
jgi:hypothetical protein